MNKVIVSIDGMHCPECEAHVNELFRRNIDRAIKIKSSHTQNRTIILSDRKISDDEITSALNNSGYRVLKITHEDDLKDSFSFKFSRKFYHYDPKN